MPRATDYAAYLDRVAGPRLWTPLPVTVDEGFACLCSGRALDRLKWADIHDGVVRVLSERVLSMAERNRHRLARGGAFPWEGSGR